jgi:hypothetical protein
MFLRQASNIREGLLVINWEALGAIGEFIGALGVVISLVYLATQIRTQNNETKLAAVHEILVGFRETLQPFSTGDLAEIFAKGNEDYDSLTNGETLKLLSGLIPTLRLWEEAYIQNEQGRLEDRVWNGINSQYGDYFNYQAFNRLWDLRGSHFDLKFQVFL